MWADTRHRWDLSSDPATIIHISSNEISCFTVMSAPENQNCHHHLKVDALISFSRQVTTHECVARCTKSLLMKVSGKCNKSSSSVWMPFPWVCLFIASRRCYWKGLDNNLPFVCDRQRESLFRCIWNCSKARYLPLRLLPAAFAETRLLSQFSWL